MADDQKPASAEEASQELKSQQLKADREAGGSSSSGSGAPAPGSNSGSASRKRVFTFQKRWLHSLPILEKTLPEPTPSAAGSGSSQAARGNGGTTDAGARDVIVCMLCDDPLSNRELTKMWSRMNCRRGRIENHLMSKHPEFMLLLKHKRDAEGDLAVQIFLQGMREGRCNLRNEISLGLFQQMQTISQDSAAQLAASSPAAAAAVAAAAGSALPAVAASNGAELYAQHRNKRAGVSVDDALDHKNKHKRAKQMSLGAFSDPQTGERRHTNGDELPTIMHHDAASFSQWHSAFFNKLVVITGADNPAITAIATNLWLLGAGVLLTFSSLTAMDEFTTNHIAQFPDTDSMEHRGMMLPMLCSFQSRKEIGAWSRSIASKFSGRVHFLINYMEDDASDKTTAEEIAAVVNTDNQYQEDAEDSAVFGVSRLLDICQSIRSLCFQPNGSGSIINIVTPSDRTNTTTSSAGIEMLTTALVTGLQSSRVQLNSIVLQRPDTEGNEERASQISSSPDMHQNAALLHSILFLLSPTSALVSGSVLRLQHSPSHSTEIESNPVLPVTTDEESTAAAVAAAVTTEDAEVNDTTQVV